MYPNGSLASQVLGVVNVDNEGITGLEKQYNEVLTVSYTHLDVYKRQTVRRAPRFTRCSMRRR